MSEDKSFHISWKLGTVLMVGGDVHPVTRSGVGSEHISFLSIWFVNWKYKEKSKSSPAGPWCRHQPELLDKAHLEMCFIFLFKILSIATQDVVEVRIIKWREKSLLRIQEVNPCDETSTELCGRRSGIYMLSPVLKTIKATECV